MKSTTRFSKNIRGIECLNCKQPIADNDNFCSNCGQVNDELPLSIKQFVSEFFSGFFSFDSRFFKTFVPLLFKPGKVSKEYIEGKRRRYVSPFQLYLHVTIVFFLLQGLFSAIDEYNISDTLSIDDNEIKSDTGLINNNSNDSMPVEVLKQKLTFRIDSIFKNTLFLENFKNDSISKKIKDSIYNNFQETNMVFIVEMIDNDATGGWGKYGHISTLKDYMVNYTEKAFKNNNIDYNAPSDINISLDEDDLKYLFGEQNANKLNAFYKYNEEYRDASSLRALTDLNYEKTRWNAFLYKMAQNAYKAKEDSGFFKTYGQSIISKISFALFFLLPIFTLFLTLLYIRRKWNYTEHLVFVFNVQTVFFLLLIFFTIFDRILKTDLGIGLFIPIFLFYLFRALRNFYKQHWFKTFIKFILLNSIYIVLGLFGTIIIAFIAFIF